MVAADVYLAQSALDQLRTLGEADRRWRYSASKRPAKPEEIARGCVAKGRAGGFDVCWWTRPAACRSTTRMRKEMWRIRAAAQPDEVLAGWWDSMIGQRRPTHSAPFHDQGGLTGAVLTKLRRPTSRGGAALSIRKWTVPDQVHRTREEGEAPAALSPERMASRFSQWGDVLTPGGESQQGMVELAMWRRCSRSCRKATFTTSPQFSFRQMPDESNGWAPWWPE